MRRQKLYTLIEIPRIGKQTAVNDQIGEIGFVALNIKSLDFWASPSSTKQQLVADPDVRPIRYDRAGKWLSSIRVNLLGEEVVTVDPHRFPKKQLRPASKKIISDRYLHYPLTKNVF